jgi:ferric-dicitrate binding protein FerR (iron transport regulator)
MSHWFRFIAILMLLAYVAGCSRCQDGTVLATLQSKDGEVQRDQKAAPRQWGPAEIGAGFRVGDAARTEKKSTAVLALDDGSRLKMKELTTIRFADRPPNSREQALSVVTGEALLEAAADGSLLRTSTGLARIEGKSQVVLRKTDRGVRFEVKVGKAIVEANGERTEVGEGEGFLIGVGDAVIEPTKSADDAGGDPNPEATAVVDEDDPKAAISATVSGVSVSARAPGGDAFTKLKPGAVDLEAGSALKVGRGSSVEVQRGKSSASLGQGSYRVGEGSALVVVDSGNMRLQTGARTRFVVPGGVITTAPGAHAEVTAGDKQGTSVKVHKSSVELNSGESTEKLGAGEEGLLGADGKISVAGRGLNYADITVAAGQSAVVHDPGPPTAIRLDFVGKCPRGGIVRSGNKKQSQFASGEGAVALAFSPGAHSYELHCLDDDGEADAVAASGNLTILHDAGMRPVPKKPPSTGVLADGRTYTVLYQNQLPQVSITWKKAPDAGAVFQSLR